jgi:hypothetical protein
VLDAFELETQGRPTITICHAPFERSARHHAATLGLADLPLLVEPAPKGSNLTTDAHEVAARNLDRVLASLTLRGEAPGR